MKKLFIGKLSFSTTELALRSFFNAYEPLKSVALIKDKFSGESRGFAFIEIENDQSATEAITALNGASLDGKEIVVSEARPSNDGPRGSGGPNRSRGNNTGYSNHSRY